MKTTNPTAHESTDTNRLADSLETLIEEVY